VNKNITVCSCLVVFYAAVLIGRIMHLAGSSVCMSVCLYGFSTKKQKKTQRKTKLAFYKTFFGGGVTSVRFTLKRLKVKVAGRQKLKDKS